MDNKEKLKLYEVVTVHGFRLRVNGRDEKDVHETVLKNGVLYTSIEEIKSK